MIDFIRRKITGADAIDEKAKQTLDNYNDLLKQLAHRLMGLRKVISVLECPTKERENLFSLWECASDTLFIANLIKEADIDSASDIDRVYAIVKDCTDITVHCAEIESIAKRFIPEKPKNIEPKPCSHTFTGHANKTMERLASQLKNVDEKMEEFKKAREEL